ncbi:hypothetical protein V2J09_021473 [Rumex salicifolius]
MAPKKKHQQKPKNSKPQQPSSSSSSSSGPKLQISAENEQRLRRLLLNKTATPGGDGGGMVQPSAARQETEESLSLSRTQRAKKLKAVYEKLSCEGFSNDQIESALSALKDGASFEVALDWLCLNLSHGELPQKFSAGSNMHINDGSVGVLSTARDDWTPAQDTSRRVGGEVCETAVQVKRSWDDESLNSHQPSQADWIRQYMEKEEENESESWEDNLFGDDSSIKVSESRPYDTIVTEYQAARDEAVAAKAMKDKKRQEKASSVIRKLKQEMSALGISDDMLVHKPVVQSIFIDEDNSDAIDKLHEEATSCPEESSELESITAGDVMQQHSSSVISDDSLVFPVMDKTTTEEQSEDVELGSFFLEVESSGDVLPPEVLKMQKKEKSKIISRKALETLEGVWKKGDPQRIPKALLQLLCVKSGWDSPKYNKEGTRGNGFNYTVSVMCKSTGRGKSRKAGGLISLQLPDPGKNYESAEEAQNKVAMFALYRLFPDLPFELLVTEPYALLVAEWDEGESFSDVKGSMDDRRDDFVQSLLNAGSPELTSSEMGSSYDTSTECSAEHQIAQHSVFTTANQQRHKYSRERENSILRQELQKKRKMPSYMDMLKSRASLPIAKSKDEILKLLKENNVLVVCGETGSGKTTQVPQYILDDMIDAGLGGNCNIICTQPRRIAAISVAERVADERCEPSPGLDGSLVGYQVRLDSARNDKTKLLFCTTGILLRRFAGDQNLAGVTHVIVDEVHERSLLGDFLLIVLKSLLQKQAADGMPTLKIILMSATVDAGLFSRYFGVCPVITAEGRTHPVSTYFLEDIYERINYRLASDSPNYLRFDTSGNKTRGGPVNNHRGKKNLILSSWGDDTVLSEECYNPNYIPSTYESFSEQTRINLRKLNEDMIDYDLIDDLVCHIDETCDKGAILVFLPLAASRRFSGESAEWLLPLHSSVAAADQKKVFLQPPENIRKVIVATNVAETSLTIDDVVYVIDSGKHKENRYDPKKKLSSMVEDWISQANAKQRRGRAGRVKPGICYCLYTQHRFERLMRPFQVPEMLRVPLVELCLQIKLLLLGDIKDFLSQALEPPKDEAVSSAISLLHEVGAVDGNEELTPLGYHLAKLPVDLLVGKMMVYSAIFGCLSPILSISAFLSHKSPFVYPKDEREVVERSKLALLSDKLENSNDPSIHDRHSDHIVMMVAYNKWEKVLQQGGARAAQKFCSSYFLSSSVMHTIRDMRVQFGMLLADIGLISLPKKNQVRESRRQSLVSWLSDMSQPFNKYSQHSAVVKVCIQMLPQQSMVETTRVFLRDTTIISPYSLLLFGGPINIQHQVKYIFLMDILCRV